jgi:hypothetical protein
MTRPMTVVGHWRRFDPQPVTSGLPQTTDIARRAQLVRFVPRAELASTLSEFTSFRERDTLGLQAGS